MSSNVLSGLHTANLGWQTRVGPLQKVGKLVPSVVKLASNSANTRLFAAWRLSAVVLKQVQYRRKEETESGGEIERLGQNPICTIFFCLFLVSLWVTDETSHAAGQL